MSSTYQKKGLSMQANRTVWLLCILSVFCGCGRTVVSSQEAGVDATISLKGTWQFALDRDDAGMVRQWYNQTLKDQISLPGILQSQGYGDPIAIDTPWVLSLYDRYWYLRKEFKPFAEPGNVKVPFLCQPPLHYLGPAWYQRTIHIPADWRGRRIGLFLERTRWESTVWIDGRKIGTADSLVAPHEYELGMLAPGDHRLTIRVDNRMKMDYRPDGHSVSDSLGSTWNGIVGKIDLFSTPPVWIDQVQAFSDIQKKSVRLRVDIGNATNQSGAGTLQVGSISTPVSWTPKGGQAEIQVDLGQHAELWDEFNPVLHHLTVNLKGNQAGDSKDVTFGLRKISTDGNILLVNGRPSHFRGTHSGGDFPLTGYPATDLDYWQNLFKICKQWSINHVRFHSFCPPEAAFTAADRLGIYLQPEAGMWNVINPGTSMEKRMYEETDRMIRAYGNHPSFILMSPSNEPKGYWKDSLSKWVEHYRQTDPRRLYTTGTGWPLIETAGHVEGADFLAVHRIGPKPVRGNSAWFGRDYLRSMQGTDVPIIVHELGQWCAYPDFDVIKKFTGYMQPGNYEIYQTLMKNAGLEDMDKPFSQASGHFQAACYKEEIEANLRTPGLAGFQLLDLHDYVGQGTALVGVLDPFWQEKGYLTAKQWRRFCNTTVPLAILKKRTFTTGDTFDSDVQIAHYGKKPINNALMYWQICGKDQKVIKQGQWLINQIPLGSAIPIGHIQADLSQLPAPGAYQLIVGVSNTPFENDWNFWLYPEVMPQEQSSDIVITRSFDEAVKNTGQGKKVLFMPHHNQLQWQSPPVGRVPIFWNRLMGPNWERFLGLVCAPNHPALAQFPTEYYYDWQWEQVFRPYTRAINLDTLPQVKPIVQIIDDWNRNYNLAGVFECRIGKGRLMVCAADLQSSLSDRPVAAQLRKSLLDYMETDAFNPSAELTPEQLLSLRFDNQIMQKLGAVASAAPEDGSDSAARAVDGNPNTYWTTAKRRGSGKHPHELTIRFLDPVEMTGLIIMNRQDQRQHEGDIKDYIIQQSADGKQWQTVMTGQLESTFDPQTILFGKKIKTPYLKLRAVSGFGRDISASLAELAVIYAGTPLTDDAVETSIYRKVATATEEMYEAVNVLDTSSNLTAAKVERVTADSESTTDPAVNALDGDPSTFWHTQWRDKAPAHPHWLMLEFKEPETIAAVKYLPRQDRANGRIQSYRLEVSTDGKMWKTAAKGKLENSEKEQTIVLTEPVKVSFLKFIAESESLAQPFTSIAELSIVKTSVNGKRASKPLYRDPIYDGAADPVLCWNKQEKKWFMFYTNRRANAADLKGVFWVHGTPIGIAESADNGATWTYRSDANIGYAKGDDTYWAPEVIEHDGTCHMYLTYVPGIFNDWSHPRHIIHLTSQNLLDWTYQSTLELACDKVIDACVMQMPDGTWRMWYNNEKDGKSIYYADSPDLYTWQDKGKAVASRGEGPKVFRWNNYLWMVIDTWNGLGVYRSADGLKWTHQPENLLQKPGTGNDDQAKGHHPDVVVSGDRAYLFYFTHPGRKGPDAGGDETEQRRSSIQVVELQYADGWLTCDRDKPTYIDLKP